MTGIKKFFHASKLSLAFNPVVLLGTFLLVGWLLIATHKQTQQEIQVENDTKDYFRAIDEIARSINQLNHWTMDADSKFEKIEAWQAEANDKFTQIINLLENLKIAPEDSE